MEYRKDEKVLSYGDVVLRRSDLDLLEGPCYLNDRLIEFYLQYLSAKFAASCYAATPSSPLLLVSPAITFWLLHCPDSESLVASIAPLQLQDREMVMFALNNNEDVEMAEGGSHWTLLVYIRKENVLQHYDSMAGCNRRQAQELANKLKPFISSGSTPPKLVEQTTPQQQNSYDCGVYVIAIAQLLCNVFEDSHKCIPVQDVDILLRTQVTSSFVHKMRRNILELISQLVK
ncbi:unnamed protein product [Sphagnum jensenii]|uniref:Ubiquitin-like protease family profile domain-containing protein n=1 Tax=Sphagnum jensenii TaxID=128206 RepID=A0ABP1ARR6_9BRYO